MATKRSKFAPSIEMQERAPYLGKAGEHFVLAELLLRQFDAALVEVDTGTDILAEKDEKLLRIQVKTRSIGSDNRSSFMLTAKAPARSKFPDYFVIALIDAHRIVQYLIFPKNILFQFVQDKLLSYRRKQLVYYAPLIKRNSQWFIKNLQHDITQYLNRFDLVI